MKIKDNHRVEKIAMGMAILAILINIVAMMITCNRKKNDQSEPSENAVEKIEQRKTDPRVLKDWKSQSGNEEEFHEKEGSTKAQ